MRTLALEAGDELTGESDRTDRDRCFARQLLCPACKVQIRALEFRLPESPLRAVENIDAGLGQRYQPRRHLSRGLGKLHGEILLLPLRQAQDDDEILAHGRPHRGYDIPCETAALRQRRTAEPVGPLIRSRPEELIDQVAMGAVEFDGVEAQPLGVRRGLAEGGNGVDNIRLAHGDAAGLAWRDKTARPLERRRRQPTRRMRPHHAHVPELRRHGAPGRMDFVDYALPARERSFPVEVRHVGVVRGGGPTHDCPLGNDQADIPGASPVIRRNLGRRHALW